MMRPTASHCIGVSRSCRNAAPARAAIAGSKLMSVPKALADRRRSAAISNVYGSALEWL